MTNEFYSAVSKEPNFN